MTTVGTRRQFMRAAAASMLPGTLKSAAGAANESPLAHATAVWHMKKSEGSGILVQGDVAIGIALRGAEYRASIERGGDGTIAEFHGGHLILG